MCTCVRVTACVYPYARARARGVVCVSVRVDMLCAGQVTSLSESLCVRALAWAYARAALVCARIRVCFVLSPSS